MDFELYSTGACIFALAVYHTYLYYGLYVRTAGNIGNMMDNAYYWTKKHSSLTDPATGVSSVQTFRNVNLVAVFIAGFTLSSASSAMDTFENSDSNSLPMRVNSLIFSIFMFCSALSWSQVLRIASHMGYMVGIFSQLNLIESTKKSKKDGDESEKDGDAAPEILKTLPPSSFIGDKKCTTIESHFHNTHRMLKQLFVWFHLGIRFMVISVPFAYFAVGSAALLISTVCILSFLYSYDYSLTSSSVLHAGPTGMKWNGDNGWEQMKMNKNPSASIDREHKYTI